jgi:hypothetical protein
MKAQSVKATELRELARKFRVRAAEAEEGAYRNLMLRTAHELEEFAEAMATTSSELVLAEVSEGSGSA